MEITFQAAETRRTRDTHHERRHDVNANTELVCGFTKCQRHVKQNCSHRQVHFSFHHRVRDVEKRAPFCNFKTGRPRHRTGRQNLQSENNNNKNNSNNTTGFFYRKKMSTLRREKKKGTKRTFFSLRGRTGGRTGRRAAANAPSSS